MKAVVLARGLARRMRAEDTHAPLDGEQLAAAAAGHKAMMPVGPPPGAGGPARPFLDYVLGGLADAGCTEVGLVIGPEHDAIRQRYEADVRLSRIRIAPIVQAEPRGTADAVLACEPWASGDDFLVMNGDNLYPTTAIRALVALREPGLPAFRRDDLIRHSNIPADRVGAFALLDVDAEGYLAAIVEKPGLAAMAAAGPSACVSMNCWRFDRRIFDVCRDVAESPRGEFELPMAVGLALERGLRFRAVPATGEVLDLSRRSDVGDVSRRLAGRTVIL